jgi:hypothetical protein
VEADPDMRAISTRALAPVLALSALAHSAPAEEYLCENDEGCRAVVETPDGREEIQFREGDIVSTEEGWVVDPGDGWVSLD